jgi:hypothetical protein
MLRWLRKRFSDAETLRLADDVERASEQLAVLGHKIDGLEQRLARHLNKLQMRDARAKRSTPNQPDFLSPEEQQILDDLRARDDSPSQSRDPFYQ